MLIADAGITVWVGVLLLVGVLGFFVMVVALVFRFLGWILRTLAGVFRGSRNAATPATNTHGRSLVCPHAGCGHINGPTALYCARCGRPLRRTYDVNTYG